MVFVFHFQHPDIQINLNTTNVQSAGSYKMDFTPILFKPTEAVRKTASEDLGNLYGKNAKNFFENQIIDCKRSVHQK